MARRPEWPTHCAHCGRELTEGCGYVGLCSKACKRAHYPHGSGADHFVVHVFDDGAGVPEEDGDAQG